jgi:tetratricopeptide (TPR) repeat protein
MKLNPTNFEEIDDLIKKGLYKKALLILNKYDNNNSKVLFRVGTIYAILKEYDNAIKFFKKTISIEPKNKYAHLYLGKIYADTNKKDLAEIEYKKLIRNFPDFVDGWISYSSYLNENNFFDETIQNLSPLSNLFLNKYEINFNLGYAYKIKKEYKKALVQFDECIKLKKDFKLAHINKIECLIKLKFFEIVSYQLSILESTIGKSDFVKLKLDLLLEQEKYFQAKDFLVANKYLIEEELFLAKISEILILNEQIEESLNFTELAIKKYPDSATHLANKGIVLNYLANYSESKEFFLKSLGINPNNSTVWSNLAVTQMMLMEYDEARESFKKAINSDPHNTEAIWNESLLDLVHGNLLDGFRKFEFRFHLPYHQRCPIGGLSSISNIRSIANKKILVWSEQGFGDSIQFVRYVELLLLEKANIYLLIQKELSDLFKLNNTFFITDQIEDLSDITFDAEVSLMSLPHFFKTEFHSIPNKVPYIKAPPKASNYWGEKIKTNKKIKIGLAVSGRKSYDKLYGNFRPIPLRLFNSLSNKYEIHIIQKDFLDPDKKFLQDFSKNFYIHSDLNDFTDTAAIIDLMDIIVSVDTSLVHLAGAMGLQTILLCSTPPTWRWFLNIPYSPWYPTVSIIRQENYGNWDGIIEKLDHKIHEIINLSPISSSGRATDL